MAAFKVGDEITIAAGRPFLLTRRVSNWILARDPDYTGRSIIMRVRKVASIESIEWNIPDSQIPDVVVELLYG